LTPGPEPSVFITVPLPKNDQFRRKRLPGERFGQLGAGLAISIGVGAALGIALHNVAVGVAVGIALGIALGAPAKRRANK